MLRPSKSAIREQFRAFNDELFGGVLPEIPVHWRRMSAYAACVEPSAKYPHGIIVLSTMDMPKCGWRGMLLHELIHAYLDLQEVDEWEHGVISDHGPVFTAECNRVGALLGLPKCEQEDSWAWPWCVHYVSCVPDQED